MMKENEVEGKCFLLASTMPCRRIGKWKYNSMLSWPPNYVVSGELHAPAELPQRKLTGANWRDGLL
jgi:hypothetical protein